MSVSRHTYAATVVGALIPAHDVEHPEVGHFEPGTDEWVVDTPAWTEHVPDSYADMSLPLVGGSLILDEGAAPHVTGTLDISIPDPDALAALDPRTGARVVVSVDAEFPAMTQHRVFDLGLRRRPISLGEAQLSLALASDEALLSDYRASEDDAGPRTHEASLRAVVDYVLDEVAGASLEAGATDADVTAYWELTNLVTNPDCQVDMAGWVTTTPNATPSRSATGGPFGGPHGISTAIGSGITGNQWTGTTAGGAAFVAAAKPSTRYTASMYLRASNVGKSAAVLMRFTNGVQYVDMISPITPITNTSWTRVYAIADCPPGFTGVSIYCVGYGFTAGQALYHGAAMITEGGELVPYFRGSQADDAHYSYEWAGNADASASRRIPFIEREPGSLTWKAGQTALDFLHPLVQAAGFRLVCDEGRAWTLRDEDFNAGIETLTVAYGVNLIDGNDVIDLDAGLWFDAQATVYGWTDEDGVQRERVDYYEMTNPPVRVNRVDVPAPYPGPGRSEYAVRRAQGRGREVTATTVADWRTKAEQTVQVILDTAPRQIGETSRVEFALDRDEMTITTRTTDIPEGAIDLLPGTIDALDGTIDSL